MKVIDDDEDYDGWDSDTCPYCESRIGGLAADVSDCDYRASEEDVAAGECPKCRKTIAIVRTHNYRLAKFKEQEKP